MKLNNVGLLIASASSLASLTEAFPLMRILGLFGVEVFECQNPTTHVGFNPQGLQGRWYQSHATWGTEFFGCVKYFFDVYETIDEAPDCDLDATWTLMSSPWNPLEKGIKSKQYDLTSDTDGYLY